MKQPPPVTGMPSDLIAALDARLAARRPRTQLKLAEHVARIAANGQRPLDRDEAERLGYPPEEVCAVFGLGNDEGTGATPPAPVRVVHTGAHTQVFYAACSVILSPGASASEVAAAVAGIEAGVLHLAARLDLAMDVVGPAPATSPNL